MYQFLVSEKLTISSIWDVKLFVQYKVVRAAGLLVNNEKWPNRINKTEILITK